MNWQRKKKKMFIASTGLIPKLAIDDTPNDNDYYCDNEVDETREDAEINGQSYANPILMRNSNENKK